MDPFWRSHIFQMGWNSTTKQLIRRFDMHRCPWSWVVCWFMTYLGWVSTLGVGRVDRWVSLGRYEIPLSRGMCKIFRKVYSLFHLRRTKTSLPRVQIPFQKVEGREVSYCRGGQNTAVLSLCQTDCWSPTNIKCLFVWKWWFANVHGFHLSFRRQSYRTSSRKRKSGSFKSNGFNWSRHFLHVFVSHSRMSRCATSRRRRQDTSAMGIKFVAGLHSFED